MHATGRWSTGQQASDASTTLRRKQQMCHAHRAANVRVHKRSVDEHVRCSALDCPVYTSVMLSGMQKTSNSYTVAQEYTHHGISVKASASGCQVQHQVPASLQLLTWWSGLSVLDVVVARSLIQRAQCLHLGELRGSCARSLVFDRSPARADCSASVQPCRQDTTPMSVYTGPLGASPLEVQSRQRVEVI